MTEATHYFAQSLMASLNRWLCLPTSWNAPPSALR